jgi:uncharacterized membrane protein YdjX (TVP38/TMEM64 family)
MQINACRPIHGENAMNEVSWARERIARAIGCWQWRTWAAIAVLAGIRKKVLFDMLFGRLISLRPEAVSDWLSGLGPWAPLMFVFLMATAVVVSPIPSVPLDIAAGLAFGLLWGTVYVLIGAEVGTCHCLRHYTAAGPSQARPPRDRFSTTSGIY